MADTFPDLAQLLAENWITLSQAAQLFPSSRNGRPVSPSCVWRWAIFGVRAEDGRVIKLEVLKHVSRYLTSREAVRRFSAAQQPITTGPTASCDVTKRSGTRTPAQTRKASERAVAELGRMQNGPSVRTLRLSK